MQTHGPGRHCRPRRKSAAVGRAAPPSAGTRLPTAGAPRPCTRRAGVRPISQTRSRLPGHVGSSVTSDVCSPATQLRHETGHGFLPGTWGFSLPSVASFAMHVPMTHTRRVACLRYETPQAFFSHAPFASTFVHFPCRRFPLFFCGTCEHPREVHSLPDGCSGCFRFPTADDVVP